MLAAHASLCAVEYGADAPGANIDHLRWRYLAPASGDAYVDTISEDGAAPVGRIAYAPRLLRSKNGELRAVNPVELLINRDHRSPRAFLELMRDLRNHDHADVVFLAPNDTSAPLYEKVLKFEQAGTLKLAGLPLCPENVLAGGASPLVRFPLVVLGAIWRVLVRGLAAAMLAVTSVDLSSDVPEPGEIDQLVGPLYSGDSWVGVRDHDFHTWRFHDGPVFRYRVRYAFRHGTLAGYAVSRITEFQGLRACILLDCVATRNRSRRVARALIADVLQHAGREHADLVAALSFGDRALTGALRRLPLLPVPRALWPEQMPFLVEWEAHRRAAGSPLSMSVTLADMDVF